MDGARKTSRPAVQPRRCWLCRILGIVLIPAAVAETGCSATSMALNRQDDVNIELVAMPARRSLLGDGLLARRKASSPQQSAGQRNPGRESSVTPESEERLLAIARLFTAQGRTQDAERIYQKLGRNPEQISSSTVANRLEQPNGQAAASAPTETSTPAAGGSANKAPQTTTTEPSANPPKAVVVNDSTTDKPTGERTSENIQAPEQNPPPEATPTASVTTASKVTPAELPPDSNALARVPTIADTPGWQHSGESSALPAGPEYTISTGISGLPRPWSPPNEAQAATESKPLRNFAPPGESFKRPILHGQSDEWSATLEVVPGKFQAPTIRPGRPGSERVGRAPAESLTAPDRAPPPVEISTSAVEAVQSPEADEEEAATSGEDSEPSLLIIPNGAGAAEKIARIRKGTKPHAVVQHENPSESPANVAELLLTDPCRDMHAPKVLEAVKLLDDDDPKRRADGAREIGLAGSEARTVLPVLHDRLAREQNKQVQARIAEAILKIAPDDSKAMHKLTELLGDPADWKTRQAAAAGLTAATNGTNPDAVTRLVHALNDSHPRVRAMVALSLGAFGPKAKDALPRLQFAATTDIPRVQEAAQAAIACIALDAKPAPAAANLASGEIVSEKDTESHEPALLPDGDERHDATSDAIVLPNGGNDERKSEEDYGDPFNGTLFDFDAPEFQPSK